jgi:predicted ribosome quality control (RQC) complex YloA/Tae2 family protein
MNNYYTLIYLIKEWKTNLIKGAFVEATSAKRNELQFYFRSQKSDYRLIFNSSGQRCALFMDRYQIPQRLNSAQLFSELTGAILNKIELSEGDRYVTFQFDNGMNLVFLLYSSNANVLLTDGEVILDSFKKSADLIRKVLPKPVVAVRKDSDQNPLRLNDLIQKIDPLLPRNIIKYYLTSAFQKGKIKEVEIELVTYSALLKKQVKPHFSAEYGFGLLPVGSLTGKEVKKFEFVNDAVAYSYYQMARYYDFELKKRELHTRIERVQNKMERSLIELDNSSISLKKAEEYEKIGHLLMANPAKKYLSEHIELENFYSEKSTISIKVDVENDNVVNAQKYYQKAKNTRKSYESAIIRKEELARRLSQVKVMQDTLTQVNYQKELQKWIAKHTELLQKIGLSSPDSITTATSYKLYEVSGYKVKVGKSAVANDELLRISHKEDIWMHARGVAGSHVVIPMSGDRSFPDKRIIEDVAKIAAFFSKAKGSSLVPVIFTKRKYVRKSKGMAPGAVFVDKEQVVLVQPGIPENN